jgi:7-keto-8-aminopelargonate synthetase-like enzyme
VVEAIFGRHSFFLAATLCQATAATPFTVGHLNILQPDSNQALSPPTAIVPALCETDESFQLTRTCQEQDVFVLPVVSPAVPEGLARLRATVIAAHEPAEIERAVDVIGTAGKQLGII